MCSLSLSPWHCSMLVPLFTLSTTNFALSDWKFRLACQATFLVGWIHSSLSAPFVWSIGLLGPYGFLHPMVLPVTPSPHCCSLAHFRCHSYTYSCLHYNPTRLLQLTLCWHASCVATVRRRGLALRISGCIPKFGHVSSYMLDVLHWLPLQQRISYHVISFVWGVSPGPRSGLSSRPLLHYHGYSRSSLSLLY